MEICIRCKEALLVMGTIVPLFMSLELKKKKSPTVSGEKDML
jgi:hypothetical protein